MAPPLEGICINTKPLTRALLQPPTNTISIETELILSTPGIFHGSMAVLKLLVRTSEVRWVLLRRREIDQDLERFLVPVDGGVEPEVGEYCGLQT